MIVSYRWLVQVAIEIKFEKLSENVIFSRLNVELQWWSEYKTGGRSKIKNVFHLGWFGIKSGTEMRSSKYSAVIDEKRWLNIGQTASGLVLLQKFVSTRAHPIFHTRHFLDDMWNLKVDHKVTDVDLEGAKKRLFQKRLGENLHQLRESNRLGSWNLGQSCSSMLWFLVFSKVDVLVNRRINCPTYRRTLHSLHVTKLPHILLFSLLNKFHSFDFIHYYRMNSQVLLDWHPKNH